MQVKSIAECSKGSILQYFRPSLSYLLSLRYLFCLFLFLIFKTGFTVHNSFKHRPDLHKKHSIIFCNLIVKLIFCVFTHFMTVSEMFLLFIIFLFTYILKTFYQERNKLSILIALFDFFDLVSFIRLPAHIDRKSESIWASSWENLSSGFSDQVMLKPGPRGYKTFSCSTQLSMNFHLLIKPKIPTTEIFFFALSLSDVVFIVLVNVKMPTIVGILIFMSRINFVLSWVEHEKVL